MQKGWRNPRKGVLDKKNVNQWCEVGELCNGSKSFTLTLFIAQDDLHTVHDKARDSGSQGPYWWLHWDQEEETQLPTVTKVSLTRWEWWHRMASLCLWPWSEQLEILKSSGSTQMATGIQFWDSFSFPSYTSFEFIDRICIKWWFIFSLHKYQAHNYVILRRNLTLLRFFF